MIFQKIRVLSIAQKVRFFHLIPEDRLMDPFFYTVPPIEIKLITPMDKPLFFLCLI